MTNFAQIYADDLMAKSITSKGDGQRAARLQQVYWKHVRPVEFDLQCEPEETDEDIAPRASAYHSRRQRYALQTAIGAFSLCKYEVSSVLFKKYGMPDVARAIDNAMAPPATTTAKRAKRASRASRATGPRYRTVHHIIAIGHRASRIDPHSVGNIGDATPEETAAHYERYGQNTNSIYTA